MSFMNTNILTHGHEPVLKFPLVILKWLVGLIQRYFWRLLLKTFTSTISKIKLIYFFNNVTKYRVLMYIFVIVLEELAVFALVYLFIPSRPLPGPLGFKANQWEWGQAMQSGEIIQLTNLIGLPEPRAWMATFWGQPCPWARICAGYLYASSGPNLWLFCLTELSHIYIYI